MTALMDKFFIGIGFNSDELEASSFRGLLYAGMVFMLGFTAAICTVSVLN